MTIIEIIGFIGSGLVIQVYVPQIKHLIIEHCSAGISRRAYTIWFIAALLLLIQAVMIRDMIFIFLQTANTLLTLPILIFARKYKIGVCPTHTIGKVLFDRVGNQQPPNFRNLPVQNSPAFLPRRLLRAGKKPRRGNSILPEKQFAPPSPN